MKPREVVQAAFRFEETPSVPYFTWMYADLERRLDAYYGGPFWRDSLVPYLHAQHIGFGTEDLGGSCSRDKFGTVLQQGNILHIVRAPLAEPTLRGYSWPDPESLEDWDALASKARGLTEPYRLFGLGFGLFERAWLLRGMENLLSDLLEHPTFVHELLDGVLDIHLRTMDLVAKRVPLEGYFGGEDWCDQRGVIMGPRLWRQFIKPRLAKIIARSHEHGLPYICHSCGNLLPLVDDLLEIGMDGLESLQPEAMDVVELKRRTQGRMVLIGGLGVQSTLPFGSPEQVRVAAQRLLRELGRGGGYVLAPAKPIMEDVPIENVVAFIEVATQQP